AAVATASLGGILSEALDKVREASGRIDVDMSGVSDVAREAQKRAAKVASNGHLAEVDVDKAGRFLDDIREKLVEAIEAVRTDIAPRAMDTLKEEVLPKVQETAQQMARRVQEDMVPTAQERATHLAEEYEVGPRARKAASTAAEGVGTLGNMLRAVALAVLEKMLEDVLPGAKRAGGQAVKTAREDVIPSAAESAGEAAQKVRETVLPKMGEAAERTPDMLSDMLQMAREK